MIVATQGETALHMAAHQGSLPRLELLLLHKAKVEATNNEVSHSDSIDMVRPFETCVNGRLLLIKQHQFHSDEAKGSIGL